MSSASGSTAGKVRSRNLRRAGSCPTEVHISSSTFSASTVTSSNGVYSADACRIRFIGARSRYIDIDKRRRALTLIVRFRPGGCRSLFPFTGERVSGPGCRTGSPGQVVMRKFCSIAWWRLAMSVPRFVSWKSIWCPSSPRFGVPDPVIRAAMWRFSDSTRRASIRDLADEFGLTERQLLNRFQASVGLGPKKCARIVRVLKAIDLTVPNPDVIGRHWHLTPDSSTSLTWFTTSRRFSASLPPCS